MRWVSWIHQLVDVEPVAGGGGDAPGGGVGLLQIALLGEVGHLVADGGGGHVQPGQLGHGLGAHRLGGGDVGLHYGAEDSLFPVRQCHGTHRPSFSLL